MIATVCLLAPAMNMVSFLTEIQYSQKRPFPAWLCYVFNREIYWNSQGVAWPIICLTEVGAHALWTTHTSDLTFPSASVFAYLLYIHCTYQHTCGKSSVLWQSIGYWEGRWSTYVRAVDIFRFSKCQEVHKCRCKILFKKDLPRF